MKRGYMEKKGLSAVVTTLIIILLVLVAVGGIWIVVNNFIEAGTEQIGLSQKCLAVDLRAVSVVPDAAIAGNYLVTLKRNAGGDTLGGVKVNIFNSTGSSGVIDFGVAIGELDTVTRSVVGVAGGANKLEFTIYFLDASGSEQLCSGTKEFNF